MGEKAATSKVMNRLMVAFEDEFGFVRWKACEALEKMGEKVVTSDVIKRLVFGLGNTDPHVREAAHEGVKRLLDLFLEMKELHRKKDGKASCPSNIGKCVDRSFMVVLELLKMFLCTKDYILLPALTYVTILEGIAMILNGDTLILYGNTEPVEMQVDDGKLIDELVKAFE
jgi:hypothetical protein